jgi:hypothetical protein
MKLAGTIMRPTNCIAPQGIVVGRKRRDASLHLRTITSGAFLVTLGQAPLPASGQPLFAASPLMTAPTRKPPRPARGSGHWGTSAALDSREERRF